MTLYDEMISFSKISNFRQIYKKFIYIDCRELLDTMLPGEIEGNITGIFAYCYVDRTEGISFRPLLLAAMREDSIQVFTFPHQEDTIFVLRLRDGEVKMSEFHNDDKHMYLYAVDPSKYSFIDLDILNVNTDEFSDFKEMIDSNYDVDDMVEEFRVDDKWTFLDKYRNFTYPDDVQALLFSEKNGIEQVWVRLTFATQNDEVFGELLNEPYQDYGCHEGTLIELVETNAGDEKVLVFTGRMARKE